MQGRRLPNQVYGRQWPEELQPGDYWLWMDWKDPEKPLPADRVIRGRTALEAGNLTGLVIGLMTPNGMQADLTLHTVRIEADETFSIRPGDGSSNSILVEAPPIARWHGYMEHGVWQPLGDCHGEVEYDPV